MSLPNLIRLEAAFVRALRNDAAGLFSLVRNLGSSVGISMVVTMLSRATQANHAQLAERIDPTGLALRLAIESGAWQLDSPEGLAGVHAEVLRQATLLAFLQDFRLMTWVSLAALPFAGGCPALAHTRPTDAAAEAALESTTGRQPLRVRMGATLPLADIARNVVGLDTVMFSFATADEDFHAPNENWRESAIAEGFAAWVALIRALRGANRAVFIKA
jgi:hypothetical protein